MKKIILTTVISLGICAFAGCGAKTSENTNAATTKNETTAGKIPKPGDVSSDKAVKVIELVDSVVADKDAWKGKEVAVTGYVSGTSSSGGRQLITLTNDETAIQTKSVTCNFKGTDADSKAAFRNVVEVKGKIDYTSMNGESKIIGLEPCELKK